MPKSKVYHLPQNKFKEVPSVIKKIKGDFFKAIKAGIRGYLSKGVAPGELVETIRLVATGDSIVSPSGALRLFREEDDERKNGAGSLSPREKEVLQLVARGSSNKGIADELSLTEGTVKVHMSNILGKLKVSSRTEAAVWAARAGLVPPADDTIEL